MASTDLKLESEGTLLPPGPVGRAVRLAFGLAVLYYAAHIWTVRTDTLTADGSIRSLLWNGILVGLFLVSYIMNIGFSRAWKKWPAVISLLLLLCGAGAQYLISGTFEGMFSAMIILSWILYLSAHLGLSFVLSAILATPGCEMRAFPHLLARITGTQTGEHRCPVGPISMIDTWEASR